MDIEKIVRGNMEIMKGIIEEGHRAIPIAIIVKMNDDFELAAIDPKFMSSEATKNQLSDIMKEMANKEDTLCVIILAEAWIKSASEKDANKYKSLDNAVDKAECILANIMGHGIGTKIAVWLYHRENGKAVFEKEPQFPSKFQECQNRFATEGAKANA